MTIDTEETTVEALAYTAHRLANEADCSCPDSSESPGAKFLLEVQDSVNERFADDSWDEDSSSEIADAAVPVYTHAVWATFVDLCAYQEDPTELGCDGSDMEQCAKVCLYMIAARLADSLAREIGEAAAG